jgi:hypothetical protein
VTRAETKARTGDVDGALKDLELGFRFAESISKDPTSAVKLVSDSIFRICVREVERLTVHFQNNPSALARLTSLVKKMPEANFDLKSVVKVDMYVQINAARNTTGFSAGNGQKDSEIIKWDRTAEAITSGKPSRMRSRAYLSRALEFWNNIKESKEWKSGDDEALGRFVDKKMDELSARYPSRMSSLYVVLHSHGYSYLPKANRSLEAHKRLAESYLAAMKFRSRNHRFPATLKEVGMNQEDPFAPGTSLRYQTQGNSMKVWSVGPDGKDDHGNPQKQLDIVSEYPQ